VKVPLRGQRQLKRQSTCGYSAQVQQHYRAEPREHRSVAGLKCLNLSNVIYSAIRCALGLDDDGIREICNGIIKNTSVETLNLSGNHFGEVGAAYLSKALGINQSIKKVDLSRNALGFRSINSLLCACRPRNLTVLTNGNYVFEEILSSVTHGVAFLVSIVGANILISDAADVYRTDYHFWACVLYSFALMFLFLSSCLFHSFFMSPSSKLLPCLCSSCLSGDGY
jgi:hypothetical protein